MSATDPFETNHLWPLITHSSPSRTALVAMRVGSAPARNGSVSANALEMSPRRLGRSQRSFCSSVAPWASSSMLPLSGACTPKIVIEYIDRPISSDIRASFICPKPGPPSAGSRNAPHSPWSRTRSWRWCLTTFHSSSGSSASTGSSGISSSSMNPRIQSSFSWNSGSVSKSHGIDRSLLLAFHASAAPHGTADRDGT